MVALFGSTFSRILENHAAQVGGFFVGIITYLVEPSATLYALWIAVALDLISRLFTEAKNHGGLVEAARDGHIKSDKMFRGTAVKITAYFFMCVLAAQAQYIFHYEAPSEMFGTIIYSILFLVEVWSIAENFEEAGVEAFSFITRLSRRKIRDLVDDGGDVDKNGGE